MRVLISCFAAIVMVLTWGSLPTLAAETVVNSAPTVLEESVLKDIGELRDAAFGATNQGQFDLAEVAWTDLLKRLPDNPAILSNRGNSRVSQGKLELAIEDFNRAIVLSPDYPIPISIEVRPMKDWTAMKRRS